MAQYTATLQSMQSRIALQRPGIDRNLVIAFLNERLRQVIDRKTNWSGLLVRTTLSFPAAYSVGTINLVNGSNIVTGVGTAWPVADAVNTTITEEVRQPGTAWVTPASLAGITKDRLLYADGAGPNPEVVPVIDMIAGRVLIPFSYPHAAGITITASSLTGLQLRTNSINPTYTVNAVTSTTNLVMDNAWSQVTATGNSYQIYRMYTSFGGSVKDLVAVIDPFQQIPLRLNVSQEELNRDDPNRTSTNSPVWVSSLGPSASGNMLWEIWPAPTTAYQLAVLYHKQASEMRLPSDTPPPFLNPNILIMGALADAFRTPCPRPPDFKDPFFSMENADRYETRFEQAVVDAMCSDEALYQRALEWNYGMAGGSLGATWEQSHSYDAMIGDY